MPWLSAKLHNGTPLYHEPSVTAFGSYIEYRACARRIEKAVGNQSVVLWIKAGNNGEVIGKRQRWVTGHHALRRPNTLLPKCEQMRRVVALGVVPAKAIERNQHHVMLALRP